MGKYFRCFSDKSTLSYKRGETITLKVRAFENGDPVGCRYFTYLLEGDDGKRQEGLAGCTADSPFVISTSCDTAGFVHLKLTAMTADNAADTSFDVYEGSFGFDIGDIAYKSSVPDDFDEYWAGVEQRIAESNPEILYRREITENVPEGYRCYDIRISTPIDTPASGILTMPKDKQDLRIAVFFTGYGLSGAAPVIYQSDTIRLALNAHGIDNHNPLVVNYGKYRPLLGGYGFRDEENQAPQTTYWQGMMIRDLAAVKYLKTMPEWDKKTLIATGGSQGGLRAMTVAAHDKDVTLADIAKPWFCDLKAESKGYIKGWRPNWAAGLDYFDTVAQATRVTCPVKIRAGLGDYICPPSTIMALYNTLKTEKRLDFFQGSTHSYSAPETEGYSFKNGTDAESAIPGAGRYRDGAGNSYEVITAARREEDYQMVVVYRALADGGVKCMPLYRWNQLEAAPEQTAQA